MCVLGLDGWGYLSTAKRADLVLLDVLTERVSELHEQDQEAQATLTINALSRALKK